LLSKKNASQRITMAAPASQVGLSLGGKVFFGGLCAGTFGLGCWQSKRLLEKQTLVESRQTDLAMEPSINLKDADASKGSFRQVRLTGTFQHDRQVLVGPRGPPQGALPDGPGTSAAGMSQAPQGYFIITPMQLNNPDVTSHATVLVNRGWIPKHMSPPTEHEVQMQERRHQHELMKQQQQGGMDPRQQQEYQSRQQQQQILQWDQPQGTVVVTVVAGKGERTYIVDRLLSSLSLPRFICFPTHVVHMETCTN
jgi:cytochrome oxidase assembly protein ShyY1